MSKKGCVYFMQVKGLHPVKIGMTRSQTPFNRCNQIGGASPFGYVVIGYIRSEASDMLESELHSIFSEYRLNGEWFDISIFDAIAVIKEYKGVLVLPMAPSGFYSSKIGAIKKSILSHATVMRAEGFLPHSTKGLVFSAYKNNPGFNRQDMANELGVSRRLVQRCIAQIKANGHV